MACNPLPPCPPFVALLGERMGGGGGSHKFELKVKIA